jgi:hypothetical protein
LPGFLDLADGGAGVDRRLNVDLFDLQLLAISPERLNTL